MTEDFDPSIKQFTEFLSGSGNLLTLLGFHKDVLVASNAAISDHYKKTKALFNREKTRNPRLGRQNTGRLSRGIKSAFQTLKTFDSRRRYVQEWIERESLQQFEDLLVYLDFATKEGRGTLDPYDRARLRFVALKRGLPLDAWDRRLEEYVRTHEVIEMADLGPQALVADWVSQMLLDLPPTKRKRQILLEEAEHIGVRESTALGIVRLATYDRWTTTAESTISRAIGEQGFVCAEDLEELQKLARDLRLSSKAVDSHLSELLSDSPVVEREFVAPTAGERAAAVLLDVILVASTWTCVAILSCHLGAPLGLAAHIFLGGPPAFVGYMAFLYHAFGLTIGELALDFRVVTAETYTRPSPSRQLRRAIRAVITATVVFFRPGTGDFADPSPLEEDLGVVSIRAPQLRVLRSARKGWSPAPPSEKEDRPCGVCQREGAAHDSGGCP